jgi:ribA/ribD-fused uncharacterized protein
MKSRIVSQECQSRRSNLRLHGIPEPVKETWSVTESIVRNLMIANLKFSQIEVQKIDIDRAHRVGPYVKNGETPRPILVKFVLFKDRERVWEARRNLKNTDIWLAEDFPAEIEGNRKILYPFLRAALSFKKDESYHIKQASLILDKLMINNKSYTIHDIGRLPTFLQPENIAKKESEDTLAFYSRNAVMSNFYMKAPFTLDGTRFSCSEKYFQLEKARLFKDNESEVKILNTDDPLECSNLGKTVKNYDNKVWISHAENIMFRANLAKFEQNKEAREVLLASGEKSLAESTLNKLWGTGLRLSDPDALEKSKWKGKNLMGKILEKVRKDLKESDN